MNMHGKKVIVVGGSLAGLMNAIVLQNLGAKVHVLERSDEQTLQSQAAGIRAGPEVYTFIETYVKDHTEYALTTDVVEVMDKSGDVVSRIPASDPLRLTTWKALYVMFRRTLEANNSQSGLPPAIYETQQLVQDTREDNDRLMVTVRNLLDGSTRSLQADLVIAADGAHSSTRKAVTQEATSPKYAGYVTWRGRVPESIVNPETREALRKRCIVLRIDGGYLISYYVPADGATEVTDDQPRQCEFVWIWYDMMPEDSQAFKDTFTDSDGMKHSSTIPRGKMQPKVWQQLLERRFKDVTNPHFIDLLEKTDDPFVSAIRDFPASKAVFLDKRIILVGDAFALCRPHAGGSTSQAALHAVELAKVWQGDITAEQWEEECVASATKAQALSLAMAEFFFTGKLPAIVQRLVKKDEK